MIYPTLQEFKDLREKYKMVGLSMDIVETTETPITLFKKLKGNGKAYLLESMEDEEKRGKYSFIGRDPFLTIENYNNQVFINENNETNMYEGNPFEIIKTIMQEYETPSMENLPYFTGGAVGYIGYDIVRNYENLPNINEDDIKLPDLHLLLTKEVIVYDHAKQKITIIVNTAIQESDQEDYKKAIDRLMEIEKEILNQKVPTQKRKYEDSNLEYSSNETKESFINKVNKAKQYIENGEVHQVVLSRRLELETKLDPLDVYENLRSINPSPYLFYIDFEDYQIIGSSPELMVKVKENILKTCPIAGTSPRGKDLNEDEKLMEELLNDEKEVAEHLMLLDLAKKDIEKISKNGTVKVSKYMDVCKCSHVMHIKSTVIGELEENYDIYDALAACLPAGTLSGFPKLRAMEIIDELENKKRGIYGGAIGYFGFNGNMDTCITIRSILFKEGKAYLQSGAGIVANSNAEKEYEETQRKLAALVQTIDISRKFCE